MTPIQERKISAFIWIVGIIVTIFCGAGLTVALSYGATKQKVESLDERTTKLERSSVNYIYVEYIIESNQRIVSLLRTTPGTPEFNKALDDWETFQDEILRRGNPTRGGTVEEGSVE